jgi:LmbE family N-acetylglucosaminyl deacetylase
VDVLPYLERKRAARQAHASQTTDVGMMLSLPPGAFTAMLRDGYYIEPGREPGMRAGWIFDEEPAVRP